MTRLSVQLVINLRAILLKGSMILTANIIIEGTHFTTILIDTQFNAVSNAVHCLATILFTISRRRAGLRLTSSNYQSKRLQFVLKSLASASVKLPILAYCNGSHDLDHNNNKCVNNIFKPEIASIIKQGKAICKGHHPLNYSDIAFPSHRVINK